MVERVVDAYNSATQYEKIEGITWYSNAFQHAATLSVMYGYSIEQIIALIAVVSPGATWESTNMSVPERMLSVHMAGITLTDIPWPLYPSNVAKAQQILDGQSGVLKGNKVKAFASAIGGNNDSVVIDGWMVKMMYGDPGIYWKDTAVSSDGMYNRMADAVRDASMFVGVAPALLQAIVWTSYRNVWKGKAQRARKNQAEKQFLRAMIDKVSA